jgi:hypothetical protein
MAYSTTLLVEAVREQERGERAWTATVRLGFSHSGAATGSAVNAEKPAAYGAELPSFIPSEPPIAHV